MVHRHYSYNEVGFPNQSRRRVTKVDAGFSGLWARDHSAMLQQLKRTFPCIPGFDEQVAQLRFVTAAMVKQHERICEHFANGRPSLNVIAKSSNSGDAEPGHVRLREIFGPRHRKLVR